MYIIKWILGCHQDKEAIGLSSVPGGNQTSSEFGMLRCIVLWFKKKYFHFYYIQCI